MIGSILEVERKDEYGRNYATAYCDQADSPPEGATWPILLRHIDERANHQFKEGFNEESSHQVGHEDFLRLGFAHILAWLVVLFSQDDDCPNECSQQGNAQSK